MIGKVAVWSLCAVWCLAAGVSAAGPHRCSTPGTGVYPTMDSLVVHSGGIVTGSAGEYIIHGTIKAEGNFWGTIKSPHRR